LISRTSSILTFRSLCRASQGWAASSNTFRSFSASFPSTASSSFTVPWYSLSFFPAFLTTSANSSDHCRGGSDANLAEEQINVLSRLSGFAKSGSAQLSFHKTLVIGRFSPPPFSGRYSEHLHKASGFCSGFLDGSKYGSRYLLASGPTMPGDG